MTTTKGELIKIGDYAYEALEVFPEGTKREVAIIKYEGLYVFAIHTGTIWRLEMPYDDITAEQKAAIEKYTAPNLETTTVEVEKS